MLTMDSLLTLVFFDNVVCLLYIDKDYCFLHMVVMSCFACWILDCDCTVELIVQKFGKWFCFPREVVQPP